jgi:hypothetical protein
MFATVKGLATAQKALKFGKVQYKSDINEA